MQAKDVTTERVLVAIRALYAEKGWATRWDMRDEFFPDVPEKVLLAKLRKLVAAHTITGCACGCRGDFNIPGENLNGNILSAEEAEALAATRA